MLLQRKLNSFPLHKHVILALSFPFITEWCIFLIFVKIFSLFIFSKKDLRNLWFCYIFYLKTNIKILFILESMNFNYFSVYGESVKWEIMKWPQSKVNLLQSTRTGSQNQVSPVLNLAELDAWSILCQDIERCKSLISKSPQEKIQLRPWTIITEIHSPHNWAKCSLPT